MKGLIFTEFFAFVSAHHGDDFVDDLLAEAGLEDAVFTSVGTYDFAHLAKLVGCYCAMTSTPFADALRIFGTHLARMFQRRFTDFYDAHDGVLDLLCHVDDQIHVEVRKLYPDAELPKFHVTERSDTRVVIDYFSCRPLADLATGLIEESARYYDQTLTIHRSEVSGASGAGSRFQIDLLTRPDAIEKAA